MEKNSEPNSVRIPVYIFVILLAWGLHIAEVSPLFSLLGFRIYIPFLPLLYIIYLRFRAGGNFRFKPFPWKSALVIIAGNLMIAGGGWFSGLLKFRLPEFHFELAASSLVDFPVYFIWCLPLFSLIWFGLFHKSDDLKKKIGGALFLLLAFSPQIYAEATGLKGFLPAIPLITILTALTGISIFSKSMLHFALFSFTTGWILLICFGTEHKLLLNTFLAYRYDNWDGFFKAKDEVINYFRTGGLLFSLLVSGILYKRIN